MGRNIVYNTGKMKKRTQSQPQSGILIKVRGWLKENEDWISLFLGGLTLLFLVGIVGWWGWHKWMRKEQKKTTPQVQVETTPSVEENKPQKEIYVVRRGDYLWKIAIQKYGDGYKWVEIARANHLVNPDLLFRGQKLIIPSLQKGEETPSQINEAQEVTYQVKPGDNLWFICQHQYRNPFLYLKVAQYNHLKNPNLIEKGLLIKLPPLRVLSPAGLTKRRK